MRFGGGASVGELLINHLLLRQKDGFDPPVNRKDFVNSSGGASRLGKFYSNNMQQAPKINFLDFKLRCFVGLRCLGVWGKCLARHQRQSPKIKVNKKYIPDTLNSSVVFSILFI